MILMDVGADGQIQTADPPFFQIFLNADPTGGAIREFAVLSAAAVDQGGELRRQAWRDPGFPEEWPRRSPHLQK